MIAPDLTGHLPTFGHNQTVFATVVQGLCNLAVHAAIHTHAHVVVQIHVDVDYAYMPRSVCAVGASTPSFGSSVEDTEGRHSASRPVERPCHAIHSAAIYGPVDQRSAVGLKGCTPASKFALWLTLAWHWAGTATRVFFSNGFCQPSRTLRVLALSASSESSNHAVGRNPL